MKSSLTASSKPPFATSHRALRTSDVVCARTLRDNFDASGRFKSAAHLRGEFYALIGAFQPWQVVHVRGSGVTACHNLLAMEAAGMMGSRVFAPSWSGWIDNPKHELANVSS